MHVRRTRSCGFSAAHQMMSMDVLMRRQPHIGSDDCPDPTLPRWMPVVAGCCGHVYESHSGWGPKIENINFDVGSLCSEAARYLNATVSGRHHGPGSRQQGLVLCYDQPFLGPAWIPAQSNCLRRTAEIAVGCIRLFPVASSQPSRTLGVGSMVCNHLIVT